MAYLPPDFPDILGDISRRKEFAALKNRRRYSRPPGTAPFRDIDHELLRANRLSLHTYQSFVRNFVNIDTPYDRLLMKHSTGAGKTIGAIAIAMKFIEYFRQEEIAGSGRRIGSVFVIGFAGTKKAFYGDLLRHPEFGFVSAAEVARLDALRSAAHSGIAEDAERAAEFWARLKKRVKDRRVSGFFEFVGYKELANRLYKAAAAAGAPGPEINDAYLASFANSLIICDEIHNVYNSRQKNNWGVALQHILDATPSAKAVFMSATPINNNPHEIVDLVNLLLPAAARIAKADVFVGATTEVSAPGADLLRRSVTGRVSYLLNKNPERFPAWAFRGEAIPGVKYLKFIRAPFAPVHYAAYEEALSAVSVLPPDSKYIIDFALPCPGEADARCYKPQDMRRIKMADPAWKKENNIDIIDGIAAGEFVRMDGLANVSGKYHAMMADIFSIIRGGDAAMPRGKIMIYHEYVNMSGAMFIKEILTRNGIIDDNSAASDGTICSSCGVARKSHDVAAAGHEFNPARFIMVHGHITNKNTISANINRFNHMSNTDGSDVMILLGTRIVKESYDIKAVRHLMVMSCPDNIPTLIQIIGRVVRNDSHVLLPHGAHDVAVALYTMHGESKRRGGAAAAPMAAEEARYARKAAEYAVIQQIETILHTQAVDADINFATIAPGLVAPGAAIGDVKFRPAAAAVAKFAPGELNLRTFAVYHREGEIDLAAQLIKRCFVEVSPVWKYADLLAAIRAPEFSVEYDTSMIDDTSFIVALSRLVWAPGAIVSGAAGDMITSIFDVNDRRIIADGPRVIKQIGEFYTLLPVERGGIVIEDIDLPYRRRRHAAADFVDIGAYLRDAALKSNYADKKEKFVAAYSDAKLDNMSFAVCEYGVGFHVRLIEEIISYVFEVWTNPRVVRAAEHDFYFKMLYYYDILGAVIFAHTAKEYIYRTYDEFIEEEGKHDPAQSKSIRVRYNPKPGATTGVDRNNTLNRIARDIEKSSCHWCPAITKASFELSIKKSAERFSRRGAHGRESSTIRVRPDILPVGHYLGTAPSFYHPNRGWYRSPEYVSGHEQWKENPIIIGYNSKSATGIHVRFKLRRPNAGAAGRVAAPQDARLLERGSACQTRPKSFLIHLCAQLGIEVSPEFSVIQICEEIRTRLMYFELVERAKGTNIKFFYSHFEQMD